MATAAVPAREAARNREAGARGRPSSICEPRSDARHALFMAGPSVAYLSQYGAGRIEDNGSKPAKSFHGMFVVHHE